MGSISPYSNKTFHWPQSTVFFVTHLTRNWGSLWGTLPLKQQLIGISQTIRHGARATFGA